MHWSDVPEVEELSEPEISHTATISSYFIKKKNSGLSYDHFGFKSKYTCRFRCSVLAIHDQN